MPWDRDQLWRDYLAYCATRTPNYKLALEYVQSLGFNMRVPSERFRAETALTILQTRMTLARIATRNAS
jgi:hypothetical protein